MITVCPTSADAGNQPLREMVPGDIVAAQVRRVTAKEVLCRVANRPARLGIARQGIARLEHCGQAFTPGQTIRAAVLTAEPTLILTQREVLGTWVENACRFRQGQTVTGVVRTVTPYGIFVELKPNLCGLAEYRSGIRIGDGVVVTIRAILPGKHKVKLDIKEVLRSPPARSAPEYFITSGHIRRWEYYPGSRAFTVF